MSESKEAPIVEMPDQFSVWDCSSCGTKQHDSYPWICMAKYCGAKICNDCWDEDKNEEHGNVCIECYEESDESDNEVEFSDSE